MESKGPSNQRGVPDARKGRGGSVARFAADVQTQVGSLICKSRQQRILKLLKLEETVTPSKCAFAIERSKGVFLAAAASPFQFAVRQAAETKRRMGCTLGIKRDQPSLRRLYMSARNGDKSRFNRERKQKIARRKHTRELLEHAAKARKSADTTVRAQPRSTAA